ncbi:type II secretion system F family protein [Stutzerimonas stutzeri]|uniref:type II secretion system F family protein n=1 Tax=Stutzerimonas stutzeri TaxID=316 RepID=UPI000F77F46E|nr:type II secretion system F family protein [Stutzerimonas stutzeri]RRV36243.1 type II secretion system F family protein [Stutzerimonas stutzeri]
MTLAFDYEAIDRAGRTSKGEVAAISRRQALKDLEAQQLTVVSLSQRTNADNADEAKGGRLSEQDVITGLFELASMLNSGVSAAEAVASEAESAARPALRAAFKRMSKTLRHGGSFSESLESAQLNVPDYVYFLVRAGELTGQVGSALDDACSQMQYSLEVRGETRNALIYPAVLVVTGILAVLMMFIYVVPSFTNLLDQAEKLPWLAWAVLSAGRWTNDNVLLVACLLVGIVAIPVILLARRGVRLFILEKLEKAPLVGEWMVNADVASWSKIMASMIRNRVELLVALELSQVAVRAPSRQRRLARARNAVKAGEQLSVALEANNCLNPTGYNLVRVGEKSGNLDEMLRSLAEIYSRQSRQRMKKVLLLIEPIAILLIGGAIGTLIIAIILAITSANDIAF